VDESAGRNQSYIEDCQICCRPNVLQISYAPDIESFLISAELE
jgi:cysteine-rich CPXCG protein